MGRCFFNAASAEDAEKKTEEFVSKDRSTILRCAAVGVGITVVWVIYHALVNPSPWSPLTSLLSVIFVILCPPVLLTFPLFDVEIGPGGFFVVCMVVALLNAAFYAAIGSVYVGIRKKREREATN